VTALRVLSAGATKVVVDLAVGSRVANAPGDGGWEVDVSFGPVAAVRERFLAGERCDIVILSRAVIDELAWANRVDPFKVASVGRVSTGLAVREGQQPPTVDDEGQLLATLLRATSIHVPDKSRSTAGAHFASVLRRLHLADVIGDQLHEHPSGSIAMEALARSHGFAIGCTQVTEILDAGGVTLVGPLPPGFGLTTEYVAAVTTQAEDRAQATAFLRALAGDGTAAARRRAGYELD
jgi:molybdate transport system substrate-binding protein